MADLQIDALSITLLVCAFSVTVPNRFFLPHLYDLWTQMPAVAYKVAQSARCVGARLFLIVCQQLYKGAHSRAQFVIQGGVVEAGVANSEAGKLSAGKMSHVDNQCSVPFLGGVSYRVRLWKLALPLAKQANFL